jgi:hypothetical protein
LAAGGRRPRRNAEVMEWNGDKYVRKPFAKKTDTMFTMFKN